MAIELGQRTRDGITEVQRQAIDEAMRILVEEDRHRGIDPLATFRCERCRRNRSYLGSVDYDGIRLCNDCATSFEIARLGGRVRNCAQYVGKRLGR